MGMSDDLFLCVHRNGEVKRADPRKNEWVNYIKIDTLGKIFTLSWFVLIFPQKLCKYLMGLSNLTERKRLKYCICHNSLF